MKIMFPVHFYANFRISSVVDEKSGTDAAFQDCFLVQRLVLPPLPSLVSVGGGGGLTSVTERLLCCEFETMTKCGYHQEGSIHSTHPL